MARRIIQDIVIGKRKKLETPAPIKIIKKEETENDTVKEKPKVNPFLKRESHLFSALSREDNKHSIPFPKLPRRKGEGFFEKPASWWSLGGLVIIACGMFLFSVYFSKASVEIIPGKASVPVEVSLNVKKSASSGIPFEIIVTKGTETKQVNATGSKSLSVKASGKIVVYNNYSGATQKLVKGTRFVASNGKTYRIQSDIIVPGKAGNVPGSIEVMVYADQAGAEYNTGLSDFTVPGFKGDPRYDKFYGRSKMEIMGGFSGMASVASDEDIAGAKISVERSLKEDLLRDASSQVPDGYILYKDAVQISFEDIKDTSSNPKIVTLGENGTLVGVLLKKDSISSEIAKKISAGENKLPPFAVDSIEGLAFSFASNTPSVDAKTKEISFSLSGNVGITYDVDTPSLKNNLVGKSRGDFSSVLSGYSSIKGARITSFQPIWNRHFPDKAEKISITIAK